MKYIKKDSIKLIKKEARRILLYNFHATGGRYITPAWPHYKNQWVWDSSFHAIAASEVQLTDLAKNEIRELFKYQDKRGWIGHKIYHGFFRWFELEIPLYGNGMKPKYSSLVGQPVIAQAVEAINDKFFTEEVIDGLVKFYKYFIEHRDALNVVSVFSPRETGRDASPEFDFFLPKALKGFKFLDRYLDHVWILWLDFKNMRLGWNEARMMREGIFHVKDVGEHCIWIDGLYSLKKLLEDVNRKDLFEDIDEVIQKGEGALIEKCWDKETKTFYSIRVNFSKKYFRRKKANQNLDDLKPQFLKSLTINSLFPLLIKNLPKEMERSIIEHISNKEEFWTTYPLPSVAINNPDFNPSASSPIWRGPTWINTNWFILRGLMNYGYKEIASQIASSSIEMIEREGYREFYNPFTGEGIRIKDFAWSTLVVTFPKLIDPKK